MLRSSFSQHKMFERCPRQWYLQYVKKVLVPSDMCYADAGNVVHDILENWYNNKYSKFDDAKIEFNNLWEKAKLNDSKIALKKDEYWLMCINGISKNVKLTSTEFKIFYPDVLAFLDGINTDEDSIIDWKTSKRTDDSEIEYREQLFFYSWLYWRKFNRMPKTATIYFLKYNGSKNIFTVDITPACIDNARLWYLDLTTKMEKVINSNKMPEACTNCNPYCPYTDLCKNTTNLLNFTLNIRGGFIYLEGIITPLLHQGLTKKFSYELKNAYFMKKHNPHARTVVNFWNSNNRSLPLGFKEGIIKTLNDYAEYNKQTLNLTINDLRPKQTKQIIMPDKFINNVTLRDYQQEAVNKFLEKQVGILEIGTGGGKTEVAIEIIRQLKVRTLFVVDKIELLKQTKKRIEDSLGIEVGMIGYGENNIKDVTVATIQTLNKHMIDYMDYLSNVHFVILDECHKVAARSYYRLGQYLTNTFYRLGLSGTAFRDDGNDMMITATAGYKIHDLSSKVLIEAGWLVKPQVTFLAHFMTEEQIKEFEQRGLTGLINEQPNYSNFYNLFISQNPFRNNVVNLLCKKYVGKKILILTKLIEHGQLLERLIEGSKHLYGGTNKTDRIAIFNDFVNGNINVLISTISIFSEGIDIPSLNVIINVGANKGNVKTIQMLGRVLRKIEGKKDALYIDFIDEIKFFRMASLARRRILIDEGHNVNKVHYEDFLR